MILYLHTGTELIRKVEGNEDAEPCFGVTFPLLLKADGRKFGKSEDGAIWLAAGAQALRNKSDPVTIALAILPACAPHRHLDRSRILS